MDSWSSISHDLITFVHRTRGSACEVATVTETGNEFSVTRAALSIQPPVPSTLLQDRKLAETSGLLARTAFECLSPFRSYHYIKAAAATKGPRVKRPFLIN
jgi:hypothetical protein